MRISDDVKKILDIGVSLTSEASYNLLLEKLLLELMNITHCDGGTLYLLKDDKLKFMVMLNHTMNTYQGGGGEAVDLPEVPMTEENVCTYCAIHRQIVNIDDVYQNDSFDFSGPHKYDAITGYHTGSMLVIPLITHEQELIGVIQLINALDQNNQVTVFCKEVEYVAYALSSLASVSLANMLNLEEVKKMLYSTVSVLTTAVDEMSPFSANHTYQVANLIKQFTDYLLNDKIPHRVHVTEASLKQEELVMAGMLHDVGKISVPNEILYKPSKLHGRKEIILNRLKLIRANLKNDWHEGIISKEVLEQECKEIEEMKSLVTAIDQSSFLTDDLKEKIDYFSQKTYEGQGEKIPYIAADEKEHFLIPKGTLTQQERAVIESHVVVTKKMLDKIRFGRNYQDVATWASQHHEFLDGSGYPNHLTKEQIPIQTRILTITDIYDALVAIDRPYKASLSKEKAVDVLNDMVKAGKLDEDLVFEFVSMVLTE